MGRAKSHKILLAVAVLIVSVTFTTRTAAQAIADSTTRYFDHLSLRWPAGQGLLRPEGPATLEWQRGYTMILMNNTDTASANRARDYVVSQGGRIAVLVPPQVMFGWVSPELAARLLGKHGIESLHHGPVSPTLLKWRDQRTLAAASFFNSVVDGTLAREAAEAALQTRPEPLTNDVLDKGELNYEDYKRNLARLGVAPALGNSDSLTGTVAVALFFVESNGAIDSNSYSWSSTDQSNTFNRAMSGLSWWSNRATSYGKSVTFSAYMFASNNPAVQQGYEPILHSSGQDGLWIEPILANLGFTTGNKLARAEAFNTWLRGHAGTDRAYSVFIAYNPSPAPNRFTDRKFAYAYLGGPYVQMLFRNDGWTASNFGLVFAHETGHIFWACDEYFEADYGGCESCSACAPQGPRPTALNGNCEVCNSNAVSCIMHSSDADALCGYTVEQIGWGTGTGGGDGGCSSTSINVGQTLNGSLTSSDCVLSGTSRRYDVYSFNGQAGQGIAASMDASAFDTYLYITNSANQVLDEDNNSGPGTNSRIPNSSGFFTLPATGSYFLWASSASDNATGSYSISLSGCTYALSTYENEVGPGTGSTNIFMDAPSGCEWSAVSDSTSWLTTSSTGSGDGTVNYERTANPGTSPRTGRITAGGQVHTVTQIGVGGAGNVRFSSATYNANEGGGDVTVTVTRAGGTGTGSVQYSTSNGTATAGADYVSTSGTLLFGGNETSKSFTVTILDDTALEGNETINLSLNNNSSSFTLGNPNAATLTIIDDEISPTPTPTPTPTSGLQFYPLPRPVRLLDTRAGQPACYNPAAPLAANSTRTQAARVTCGGLTIPAEAQAVVGNATIVNDTGAGAGYVTLFSSGGARPTVSNINYNSGQVLSNAFTVGLGTDGAFQIYSLATTNFIVDITGYYALPGAGGLYYHPLPRPVRLLDTRIGQTACDAPGSTIPGGGVRTELARLTCAGVIIPNDAQAIVGNATVVNDVPGGGPGFITLYPSGAARPTVSTINYNSGQVLSNAFTVGLGPDGAFSIYAHSTINLIVDVTGYYSPAGLSDANGVAGLLYSPLSNPFRLLETRPGEPACNNPGAPLPGGSPWSQAARGTCGAITIPSDAQAIVGNATVVNTLAGSGFGYITLYPGGQPRPLVSNINYTPGQVLSNAFTVGLGPNGAFQVYPFTTTHFIADVTGYFAPPASP